MNLFDSLINNINTKTDTQKYELENNAKVIFTLQLFYSDSLEFQEVNSVKTSQSLFLYENINTKLYLSQSPKYLRIDPGYFYSVHDNVKVNLSAINGNQEDKIIDCIPNKNSITNQLHVEKSGNNFLLICGKDPHYVFENSFKGCNICIHFQSRLLLSI